MKAVVGLFRNRSRCRCLLCPGTAVPSLPSLQRAVPCRTRFRLAAFLAGDANHGPFLQLKQRIGEGCFGNLAHQSHGEPTFRGDVGLRCRKLLHSASARMRQRRSIWRLFPTVHGIFGRRLRCSSRRLRWRGSLSSSAVHHSSDSHARSPFSICGSSFVLRIDGLRRLRSASGRHG